MPRVELGTSSLPRKRSTTELHRQKKSGKRDSNPRPSAWKANALSTELLPQYVYIKNLQTNRDSFQKIKKPSRLVCILFFNTLWAKMDSNHRSRKTADLQSAPFGHSGICPITCHYFRKRICDNFTVTTPNQRWSLLSDSNQRPRDYKSRALAN